MRSRTRHSGSRTLHLAYCSQVPSSVEQAVAFYRDRGCEIHEISLPHTEYAIATYYIIATAEASSACVSGISQ